MTEVTGRKAWLYGDRQVPGPVLAPPYLQRPADAMEDTMPRQAASTNIPAGFTKNPVIARRAVVLALDCQAALLRARRQLPALRALLQPRVEHQKPA